MRDHLAHATGAPDQHPASTATPEIVPDHTAPPPVEEQTDQPAFTRPSRAQQPVDDEASQPSLWDAAPDGAATVTPPARPHATTAQPEPRTDPEVEQTGRSVAEQVGVIASVRAPLFERAARMGMAAVAKLSPSGFNSMTVWGEFLEVIHNAGQPATAWIATATRELTTLGYSVEQRPALDAAGRRKSPDQRLVIDHDRRHVVDETVPGSMAMAGDLMTAVAHVRAHLAVTTDGLASRHVASTVAIPSTLPPELSEPLASGASLDNAPDTAPGSTTDQPVAADSAPPAADTAREPIEEQTHASLEPEPTTTGTMTKADADAGLLAGPVGEAALHWSALVTQAARHGYAVRTCYGTSSHVDRGERVVHVAAELPPLARVVELAMKVGAVAIDQHAVATAPAPALHALATEELETPIHAALRREHGLPPARAATPTSWAPTSQDAVADDVLDVLLLLLRPRPASDTPIYTQLRADLGLTEPVASQGGQHRPGHHEPAAPVGSRAWTAPDGPAARSPRGR